MPASHRYKNYINLVLPIFNTKRTREILQVNPVVETQRTDATETHISVYEYSGEYLQEFQFNEIKACLEFSRHSEHFRWINIDGLRKADVNAVCGAFDIHPLLEEDILSIGQRPKMDEINERLFCVLNMLYFNENTSSVESEQISIALGKNFVISFQEDPSRDVFNPLREKLKIASSKIRQSSSDYLCYTMLDLIVDNYFVVMERIGDRIEDIEEEIIRFSNTRSLARINRIRKELIVLKRNFLPVRELIGGIIRSDSDLLEDRTTKYFKDIYDHILQAADLAENYRDMVMNLQDLYISNVNMKMNEVMKIMAIVTCLLAPATVIGGIFGMNFDKIPYLHNEHGFWIAVGLMLLIPVWMLWVFKKRNWF